MRRCFVVLLVVLLIVLVPSSVEAKKHKHRHRHHRQSAAQMQGAIPALFAFVNAPDGPDGLWEGGQQNQARAQARDGLDWWSRNLPGSQLSWQVAETTVWVSGDPLTENVTHAAWVDQALGQIGPRTGIILLFVHNWTTGRTIPYVGGDVEDYSPGPWSAMTTDFAQYEGDPEFRGLVAHSVGHLFGASHRGGGIMDPDTYDQAFAANALSDTTVREVGGVR